MARAQGGTSGSLGKGALLDATTLTLTVCAPNATRIEAWLYARPKAADEVERVVLAPLGGDQNGLWRATIALDALRKHAFTGALYYGLRAWGPNWPFAADWQRGSELGFIADVDEAGNRFNPNKLLIDPYAIELSHDPEPRLSLIDPNECSADYDSGPGLRQIDTGASAPKSVVPLRALDVATGAKPRRPLRDDVIYEVHVRGLTRRDASIPEPYRGTFRGAGMKAARLRELGITAVELLPVQHFASEQNDDGDPRGDNYWGYMTLGFFAPNRRYAADQTPGGPIREFKEMVRAFHEAGIKVFLDVVYNHTGEGLLARTSEGDDSRCDDARQLPERARLLSVRGLDNASYYTLRSRLDLDAGRPNQRYQDNSACGPSLNVAHQPARELVLDSLLYWTNEMGVDGFRFDLAPVLGNTLREGGFAFDASAPDSLLQQMGRRLPLRSAAAPHGVDLIAEPWAVGDGTYQLGRFPDGWAEWNDVYRKTLRRAENKFRVSSVSPWQVADALSGSDQLFGRGASTRSTPGPSSSINYVASHDGLTLRDLFSYTDGEDAWDHAGDPAEQRKAVRNALALLMTSAGVPMLLAGDELFRTQDGRANTVAIDDESVYLDWANVDAFLLAQAAGDQAALTRLRQLDDVRSFAFARALIRFRAQHPALRPANYLTGKVQPGRTLKDLAWYGTDGQELRHGWDDPELGFLAFRLDCAGEHASIYVAYCWRDGPVDLMLPVPRSGMQWRRVADTAAWMEALGNVDEGSGSVIEGPYRMHPRSVAIFVERRC
jgi:glycogen operon protein